MQQRIALFVILAALAYFVILKFNSESFVTIETPAPAPIIVSPPLLGDMPVSPGGPNPPNVDVDIPRKPAQIPPPPEARDPQDMTAESAAIPERLRHPEESFGPGIVNNNATLGAARGIAGPVTESSQAIQQFSPENITNGGTFFGEISAMEDENPNQSSF